MTPIKFEECNVTFAENQEEYLPLPAFVAGDKEGTAVFCFELSNEEIKEIVETKRLWFTTWTFNNPLQPILLSTQKPEFKQ